jgi:hypothetical protein
LSSVSLEDASHHGAIGKHVEIVVAATDPKR